MGIVERIMNPSGSSFFKKGIPSKEKLRAKKEWEDASEAWENLSDKLLLKEKLSVTDREKLKAAELEMIRTHDAYRNTPSNYHY